MARSGGDLTLSTVESPPGWDCQTALTAVTSMFRTPYWQSSYSSVNCSQRIYIYGNTRAVPHITEPVPAIFTHPLLQTQTRNSIPSVYALYNRTRYRRLTMGSRHNSPPSETRLVDCNSAPRRLSITVTNSASGRQALWSNRSGTTTWWSVKPHRNIVIVTREPRKRWIGNDDDMK